MSTTFSKSSFDRFDDDLCEVILSYLPLEDKFRYEYVCHQWKAHIFNKVNRLAVYTTSQMIRNLMSDNGLKQRALEKFFKKCTNITKVYMESAHYNFFHYNQLLQTYYTYSCSFVELVIKYCPHLRSIDNSMYLISPLATKRLLRVFGPQLKSLICYNHSNFEGINCDHFKSLRHLNVFYVNRLTDRFISLRDSSDTFPIKTLVSLKISCNVTSEESVRKVISSNKNLEYLNIWCFDLLSLSLETLFNDFSKLPRLKQLLIHLYTSFSSCKMFLNLKELGKHCRQLEKLVIIDTGGKKRKGPSFFVSTLKSLEYFPNLVILEIRKDGPNDVYFPDIDESVLSIKSLKNCPNLRHLKLFVKGLRDSFFIDIDKYLPNLIYLELQEANTTAAIVDILLKLKSLQIFVFENVFNYLQSRLSREAIDLLFVNCLRLKSIHLRYEKDICRYYRGYAPNTLIISNSENPPIYEKFNIH